MTLKLTTYKTLTGKKEIAVLQERKSAQWIVYQNKKATYFVDCFNLKCESNLAMNNLVLSQRTPIEKVLKEISKKNNVALSLERAPLLSIEIDSEIKSMDLNPIPLEWLN